MGTGNGLVEVQASIDEDYLWVRRREINGWGEARWAGEEHPWFRD